MKCVAVEFDNQQGRDLAGVVDLPDGTPRAFALFAHCFTGSKDLRSAVAISRALVAEGFGVLRFDFTGLGESEGAFENTNFSSNVSDLDCAEEFLAEAYERPTLLIGHSLGGTAALSAARRMPSCRAVATIGSPADPEHVLGLLGGSRGDIERDGAAEVILAGRRFRITKQFIDDVVDQRWQEAIRDLGRALMILHSPDDDVVGIDNAALIYRVACHPKSFLSLDGADHLLSREEDARYVGNVLAAWAARYLR